MPEPAHPRTQRLLRAAPVPDPERQQNRRTERRVLLAAGHGQNAEVG